MFNKHRTSLSYKEAVKKYGNPPAVIPERVEVFAGEDEDAKFIKERLARMEGGEKE